MKKTALVFFFFLIGWVWIFVPTATAQEEIIPAFSLGSDSPLPEIAPGDSLNLVLRVGPSQLTAPFGLTASWRFEGDEVADYVLGSAKSSTGTTPSLDLLSRQIVWNIPSGLMGEQEFTFALRPKKSYPFVGRFSFLVEGELSSSLFSARQLSRRFFTTYSEKRSEVVKEKTTLALRSVEVMSVWPGGFRLKVESSEPTEAFLKARKAEGGSDLIAADSILSPSHFLSLEGLEPDTVYRFSIALRKGGSYQTSEEFRLTTPKAGNRREENDFRRFAVYTSAGLQLIPDSTLTLSVLPSSEILVKLPMFSLDDRAFLLIGGRVFPLGAVAEKKNLIGSVQVPQVLGRFPVYLSLLDHLGNFHKTALVDFLVVPYGRVSDSLGRTVEGANVSLLIYDSEQAGFRLFQAGELGQSNPQTTGKSGLYAFLVPVGTYKLKVERPGFLSYTSTLLDIPTNQPLRHEVVLTPLPSNLIVYAWYRLTQGGEQFFDFLGNLPQNSSAIEFSRSVYLPFFVLAFLLLLLALFVKKEWEIHHLWRKLQGHPVMTKSLKFVEVLAFELGTFIVVAGAVLTLFGFLFAPSWGSGAVAALFLGLVIYWGEEFWAKKK